MPINPNKPLITVPPDPVHGLPVRFLALSADGINAIVEIEVIPGLWRACSVDKRTGEGDVVNQNGDTMPITIRNGQTITCNLSWQANNLVGGTNNNTNVVSTVDVTAVVDL